MVQKTARLKDIWFEIGINLGVPSKKLEKIEKKYGRNKIGCLAKVYRYWLDDRNGLEPTMEKLLTALDEQHEYSTSESLRTSMVCGYFNRKVYLNVIVQTIL